MMKMWNFARFVRGIFLTVKKINPVEKNPTDKKWTIFPSNLKKSHIFDSLSHYSFIWSGVLSWLNNSTYHKNTVDIVKSRGCNGFNEIITKRWNLHIFQRGIFFNLFFNLLILLINFSFHGALFIDLVKVPPNGKGIKGSYRVFDL